MTALCRFEMLLPLRFDDGHAVPTELIAETIHELEERFGAATWETQVLQGRWRHEGATCREEPVRVFVDTRDTESNRDLFAA